MSRILIDIPKSMPIKGENVFVFKCQVVNDFTEIDINNKINIKAIE